MWEEEGKNTFLTQNSGQVWILSFCKTRVLEFCPKPLGYLGNRVLEQENTSDCLINGALTDRDSLLCQKQNVAELLPLSAFLKKKKKKKKTQKKKKLGILLSLELTQGEISSMFSR